MKRLTKKVFSLLLTAVMLLLMSIGAFAGGDGIAEVSFVIKDAQTPAQFTLTPQDLTGSFIFTNAQGDTVEVAPAMFTAQSEGLRAFFALVAEDPDDHSVLVKSPGTYTLTQYPALPQGYSFDTAGKPPSFELGDLEPYWGTFDITLQVNSGLASAVPAAPATPTAPPAAALTAKPTASGVIVNGNQIAFDAYNIDGSNYFKLRDLAYALSGSEKQFEVGWDGANNAITLTSGMAYTAVGKEMTGKGSGDKTAAPTTSKIYLDGKEVSFTAYNIEGNNYFKLRDIGQALDFAVIWDSAKNTIVIDTGKGYTAD